MNNDHISDMQFHSGCEKQRELAGVGALAVELVLGAATDQRERTQGGFGSMWDVRPKSVARASNSARLCRPEWEGGLDVASATHGMYVLQI